MNDYKQVGGNHYICKDYQCWDAIIYADMGYLLGNAVKYISRYGGLEDLEKAKHYLEKLQSGGSLHTICTGPSKIAGRKYASQYKGVFQNRTLTALFFYNLDEAADLINGEITRLTEQG